MTYFIKSSSLLGRRNRISCIMSFTAPPQNMDCGGLSGQQSQLWIWAVVVAQLVERSTPEIRGSNPNIGKILSTICTLKKRKDENKEKRGREWSIFKKSWLQIQGSRVQFLLLQNLFHSKACSEMEWRETDINRTLTLKHRLALIFIFIG